MRNAFDPRLAENRTVRLIITIVCEDELCAPLLRPGFVNCQRRFQRYSPPTFAPYRAAFVQVNSIWRSGSLRLGSEGGTEPSGSVPPATILARWSFEASLRTR